MNKIIFENLPSTSTPLSAENFNQMQNNIENAIVEDFGTSSADIDDINKTSFRYIRNNGKNPYNENGYLKTHKMNDNYIIQEFTRYNGQGKLHRAKVDGYWTDWIETNKFFKAKQVSSKGWYRIASIPGTGHTPCFSSAILTVGTNYSYLSPCTCMFSLVTTWKKAKLTQINAVSQTDVITQLRVIYDENVSAFYIDAYYNTDTPNAINVVNESIGNYYAPVNIQIPEGTSAGAQSGQTIVDTLTISY